ncbi:MAG: hypothetical protein M1819_000112 [Sarea resinae]|nr:MAG: hypothetical protein M1819_000112 [Sarea resinae]
MEAYPEGYIVHNVPLLVLSGLGPDHLHTPADSVEQSYPLLAQRGFKIGSEVPPVANETADRLLQDFLHLDSRNAAWNGRLEKNKFVFRMKAIGRKYILPPHKADAPQVSPTLPATPMSPASKPSSLPILHSPLSPLSPESTTFPDGVMTPLWVDKHQSLLPAAFVSFFTFTSDPSRSTLCDNQLKTEINKIKRVFESSSYKTRFVVVLLSESSILGAEADERLSAIRRATGLDNKTSLFFLPPDSSRVEIQNFAVTVLSTVYPLCVEYYRDLSKHSRRKRNRGIIPPPTIPPTSGTSQTLPSQGWNVRYEYKLGVFAEFRQEMDAAGRSYEGAYESLLGQEVFEIIASWSPRFNEARLLADTIAIRIIRCLLWNGQTTSAVQSWSNHRSRLRDLVDRRGKGSSNYGWEAWEARWATVMAELLQKAELPELLAPPGAPEKQVGPDCTSIFMPPEKGALVGDTLLPSDHLHHPGYWFNQSVSHLRTRRTFAEAMPEEDRVSPGQSPASQVASKSYLYDTYLCPEPHIESPLPGHKGIDHSALIVDALQQSIAEFRARGQKRAEERLKLDVAKEFMGQSSWAEAQEVLEPLWQSMSWRKEGWWELVEEVGWALKDCASRTGDSHTFLAVEWELMNEVFALMPGWNYNFSDSLNGLQHIKTRPHVSLKSGNIVSFMSATYCFESLEGNVGESVISQLVLKSRAHKGSAPITFSQISINYIGSSRTIQLRNPDTPQGPNGFSSGSLVLMDVSLSEVPRADHLPAQPQTTASALLLEGKASLTFFPGQTKVFSFSNIFREAGEVRVDCVIFSLKEPLFDLDCSSTIESLNSSNHWWANGTSGIKKRPIARVDPSALKILPRPPKMEIQVPTMRDQYFTDEMVTIQILVLNEEEEEAEATLDLRLLSRSEKVPEVIWSQKHNRQSDVSNDDSSEDNHIGLPGHSIGKLRPTASALESVSFATTSEPTEYVLEIKVLYHLLSDLETPISKTLTANILIVRPFEANYDFQPQIHHDKWPSFFQLGELAEDDELDEASLPKAVGIAQSWHVASKIASFAVQKLVVEDTELLMIDSNGGRVSCSINPQGYGGHMPLELLHGDMVERSFVLDARKLTLEDRNGVSLDLALVIKWRRPEPDAEQNVTSLAAPRLAIRYGEPRVLASAYPSKEIPALTCLDYYMENPSMHLLTFDVSMEASEDFAFSGPKLGSLQVLPLSRRVVRYSLLPSARGTWIQPQLKVVDRYFNKTLKVIPTTGMRMDKQGILVWVDADEEW